MNVLYFYFRSDKAQYLNIYVIWSALIFILPHTLPVMGNEDKKKDKFEII